jgi:hypothetical protein
VTRKAKNYVKNPAHYQPYCPVNSVKKNLITGKSWKNVAPSTLQISNPSKLNTSPSSIKIIEIASAKIKLVTANFFFYENSHKFIIPVVYSTQIFDELFYEMSMFKINFYVHICEFFGETCRL